MKTRSASQRTSRGANGCRPVPSTKSPTYSPAHNSFTVTNVSNSLNTKPEDKAMNAISKSLMDNCWNCSSCTFTNYSKKYKCETCDAPKGSSTRNKLNSSSILPDHSQPFINKIPVATKDTSNPLADNFSSNSSSSAPSDPISSTCSPITLQSSPAVQSLSPTAPSSLSVVSSTCMAKELTLAQKLRIETNRLQAMNIRATKKMNANGPPVQSTENAMNFMWGSISGNDFKKYITDSYEEVVYWKKNLLEIPSGAIGCSFVNETVKLFNCYTKGSPLELISLKAVAVMSHLLLQRPHKKSSVSENKEHLKRRIDLWLSGDIPALIDEARTLQSRLKTNTIPMKTEQLTRNFTNLMLNGKVNAALRLITEQGKGSVLPINDEVRKMLQEKHPPAEPLDASSVINGNHLSVDPIIFAGITGERIRNCALRTQGAAGPSAGDSDQWRRMCTSFTETSANLCNSMAAVARRMATESLDPLGLDAFLASRLIPLDKSPGLRPIGIGEVPRRIIAKSIIYHLRDDIQHSAGPLQLCAGQEAGCEAALHAMKKMFLADESDAILLVDADNAFNRLNRSAALMNIRFVCPPVAIFVTNCYQKPTRLFVMGGVEISSREGTTQGDPLSMPLYALAIVPLMNELHGISSHVWYADDAQATGRLNALRQWWETLITRGPSFGYFPNASKTVLVVKPEMLPEALEIFKGTGISLTEGSRDLGAAIGTKKFIEKYVSDKVFTWCHQMETISIIAESSPHAAHAAFVHGLRHRWTFLQRTMYDIDEAFKPLEDIIRNKFIPALLGGRMVSDEERQVLSLPGKYGGMCIDNPVISSKEKFINSTHITRPLGLLIVSQERTLPLNYNIKSQKNEVKLATADRLKQRAEEIANSLEPDKRRAMLTAQEKGASVLVTTLPIKRHGFALTKNEFRDQVNMRYRWPLPDLPTTCACGSHFSIDHSQICHLGGFINMRHDELRNLLADSVSQVLKDVEIEPILQPLTGELLLQKTAIRTNDARSDIRARGFWTEQQNAFFDIRVFYPHAVSYLSKDLGNLYKTIEQEKKRQYNDRINQVEHGTFTPLVFSSTGGMGIEASLFIKKLATMISSKRSDQYSRTLNLLRCRITFSLIRAANICLRGSKIRIRHNVNTNCDLIMHESNIFS
jgi:hypothetical protein